MKMAMEYHGAGIVGLHSHPSLKGWALRPCPMIRRAKGALVVCHVVLWRPWLTLQDGSIEYEK